MLPVLSAAIEPSDHASAVFIPVAQPAALLTAADLDDGDAVDWLVDRFYDRVLADALLAPLFVDVAAIDLDAHLPRIKAFWRKMLLGEAGYARNMVAHHAAVHARSAFTQAHFERWLALFRATVDDHFRGPYAERAKQLATTIAANLQRNLDTCVDAGAHRHLGGYRYNVQATHTPKAT